ncbi:MAG: alanine dehydrogenase [Candidatus Aenigmarchaeota archaeon]|nr:alanine dehydrogenase [Candidatus Aenigmarchaeota archaeon]
MIIGTVKEIKIGENRVGLTPQGVNALVKDGHTVFVEKNAGNNSGFPDSEYEKQGAEILDNASEVYSKTDIIIKVKEPQKSEFGLLKENQVLFTYLHLAAEPEVVKMLLERKVTGVAYETIELADGSTPLLAPMSEVAGRMSVQIGMHYLEKTNGGFGKLLSGVPGVLPAKVTIIGTGVVGINAAKIAMGAGADVTIIGRNPAQLRMIDDTFTGRIKTLFSNSYNIEKAVAETDLLIGCVYITGLSAPKLVTRGMVSKMKPGSVIVDVAIDQGGCIETSRPTSHQNPIYIDEGVIHYCVTNMPGAVPNTSTMALTNATLPYLLTIAKHGIESAATKNEPIKKGINTHKGTLVNKEVADSLKMQHAELKF